MKKKRPQDILRRDPQKTRANILRSATSSFARSGFNGTSLQEILKQAKVNKRMVYHYYGSKEGLYRAVHIHQWQDLSNWFAQTLFQDLSQGPSHQGPSELIIKAIEVFNEFSATHQEFLRLMMWDGLEGGKVSRSIWEDIRGPLYRQMETLVQSAQDQGYIPRDLKVSHIIISFMGAILFYFGYASSLEDVFGADPLSSKALEERRKQIRGLFEKILINPSVASPSA